MCDWRYVDHKLVVARHEDFQTLPVGGLLVRQPIGHQVILHQRLDLHTHVVGQAWEKMVLDVGVCEGVTEGEVEEEVGVEVEDARRHLVDPHRSVLLGIHR